MPPRAIVLPALTAAALAIGACGEQRDAARTLPAPVGDSAATPGRGAVALDVSLVDYRLEPASPRLARPGSISFAATNDGETRHALRVDGPTGPVSSVALRPGERTTIAVRLPAGTYKWYCPLSDHERRGMVGRVRVAE